jgi:hypothetical protein
MSGYTMTQAEVLYALPGPVTKNTYTTQAVISAPPATQDVAIVKAGYWQGAPEGLGRPIWLHAEGTIATTSAATFQMVLGWDPTPGTLGTTLATPWPTLAPTAATTCLWFLDTWLTPTQIGALNGLSIQVNGRLQMSVVATGVLSTAAQTVQFQSAVTGLNPANLAALELWGTWSASAAGNTTTLQQMALFGLN